MIDYGTTARVVTSAGTFELGRIRSANFTVMAVGKNIQISIIDDHVEKEKALALVNAIGDENTQLSLINGSSTDDYNVVLGEVDYSSIGLTLRFSF